MALEDYVRETRAQIRRLRSLADALEDGLELLRGQPAVPLKDEQLIRKPTTTWKAADHLERLLEKGAKTMKRTVLIKALVDQNLVGGQIDARRRQYASLAIEKGLERKYLKEDREGVIHWIPDVRKSRVSDRHG